MSEAVPGTDATTSETDDVLVDLRNLKTYYESDALMGGKPVKAVDGVNLQIRRGETLGLVGESGCGKTTLGRTLVQLEKATEGQVLFDGTDITELSGADLKQWRRNAQIVFQDPESSLNDRLTVGEIVREPLDVHDWPNLAVKVVADRPATVTGDVTRADADARGSHVDLTVTVDATGHTVEIREEIPLTQDDVDVTVEDGDELTVSVSVNKSKGRMRRAHVRRLLETVGLREEHYYRYPHQFSGGQRQRIGIARALALEPEFVVLDEPVSALDVSVQAKILNLLEDLQAEFGLTYLFIAHDLAVVRHICDRVAVMYLGNVMELGPTEELFENPANPYTYSLLSAIPEPDPSSQKKRITLRGTPPSPRDPPSGCPFTTRCPAKIRPENYRDMSEDVWVAIELFREIVRERHRADRSLREVAKSVLGMETRFSDISEVNEEVFAEVDLPADIRAHVEEAEALVKQNKETEALRYLREEFASACDAEKPEFYDVGPGHGSLCHRHLPEYEETEEVLGRNYDV